MFSGVRQEIRRPVEREYRRLDLLPRFGKLHVVELLEERPFLAARVGLAVREGLAKLRMVRQDLLERDFLDVEERVEFLGLFLDLADPLERLAAQAHLP